MEQVQNPRYYKKIIREWDKDVLISTYLKIEIFEDKLKDIPKEK